ncbi:hypothetical protein FXO37_09729 [Capsicum annuum]|nr:hypothetical protein FXO37_09729 [Capsicum annuum]
MIKSLLPDDAEATIDIPHDRPNHSFLNGGSIFDQGLNAGLFLEKGLAIEVKRNKEDGSFSGYDIAMSLRETMVSTEGEELRARTRKVGTIFRDRKLHDSYVRNFVEYLKSNGEMKFSYQCISI